ncbi:MAG: hypothetical protein J2P49_03330, partial [Methylocapsa sp.]|nr:hypothetical protein [Methylocapsa sp.]
NDASEGPLAALEYGEDAETVRDELRDAQKWAKELWQEVLKKFRSVDLSMAVVDFWECQRDQAQWAAEKACARALAKIRQAPDSEGGDGNSQRDCELYFR